MTDTQERKTNCSQESQTINIEIPAKCLEEMSRMMAGFSNFGKAGTVCCGEAQENCCSQPEDNKGREFNIVIKMKE